MKREITKETILEHWKQGKSNLDWRSLTIGEKREWLKACLLWTGLPKRKIKSRDYILHGSLVNTELDVYCLLGETFFGYRGYFGQDPHGLNDCFTEIFIQTKNKEIIENGTKIRVQNSGQIKDVLHDNFHYIIDSFRDKGIDVELD